MRVGWQAGSVERPTPLCVGTEVCTATISRCAIMTFEMEETKPCRSRRNQLICLGLVVLTAAVYCQVLGFDFTYFDDDVYVSENEVVLRGLSWDGIRWAFSTNWQANWHPLTWVSLMLDAEIGGGSPAVFHATNLLLHIASTLLLFAVLNSGTGLPWRSGFVAALFALHPLHVESVAWVAERKDTLSTFFWMLTMLAYVAYVRSKGEGLVRSRTALCLSRLSQSFAPTGTYLAMLVLFVLGLIAKPMLVTLPIVLLAMDYWPLGRYQATGNGERARSAFQHLLGLIFEKLPLFALGAASSIVTVWAQGTGGAIGDLQSYPVGVRIANAVVSYTGYIGKMIWPHKLAVFYPHPGTSLAWWQVVGAAVLLVALMGLAVKYRKSRPYLAAGWLWYLVTLIPVIGLVQVGDQAMADRYTYVPLIGLFVALTWLAADTLRNRPRLGWVIAAITIAVCSILTYAQVGTWRNSGALFRQAVQATKDNTLAYNNLAYALYKRGETQDAIYYYRRSLRIDPDSGVAHNGLGAALQKAGQHQEALGHFRAAIDLGFRRPGVYSNLGMELLRIGDYDGALRALSQAVELRPTDHRLLYNRALVYARLGKYDKAIADLREAASLAPDEPRIRDMLRSLRRIVD